MVDRENDSAAQRREYGSIERRRQVRQALSRVPFEPPNFRMLVISDGWFAFPRGHGIDVQERGAVYISDVECTEMIAGDTLHADLLDQLAAKRRPLRLPCFDVPADNVPVAGERFVGGP